MTAEVGEKAPDFELTNQHGGASKAFLLYWQKASGSSFLPTLVLGHLHRRAMRASRQHFYV